MPWAPLMLTVLAGWIFATVGMADEPPVPAPTPAEGEPTTSDIQQLVQRVLRAQEAQDQATEALREAATEALRRQPGH